MGEDAIFRRFIWYDATVSLNMICCSVRNCAGHSCMEILDYRNDRRRTMEDKAVRQIISEIQQQLKPISELSASVIVQAELQSYTEDLYNQLVQITYEGIEFLAQLEVGQVVTADLLARRDELVGHAQHLILDAPNAPRS